MSRTLYTLGYEGAALADVLGALQEAKVALLVDVRAVAVSRRPGFSKTAFAAALDAHGIQYRHLRDLGDPKPGREAARAGDYKQFRTIYGAHLKTPAAQCALSEAKRLAFEQVSCLLCYEAEPEHCHRTIVAGAIAKRADLDVFHLAIGTASAAVARRRAGTRADPGEGRSAAE